jgi:hypothetical protein
MDNSEDTKKNFFKYVFNFDDEGKSEILNILQYFIIAFIPAIILTKVVEKYVPPKDDTKTSLEITAEIIIQLIVLILGLFFINRMVLFFPTFSGENYPKIYFLSGILSILLTSFTLSPVVSGKLNTLVERFNNVWEGKSPDSKEKTKSSNVNGKQMNVRVSQPLSTSSNNNNFNNSPIYNDSTSIHQLPNNDSAQNYALSPQSLPNYNEMYKKQTTPLVDAASPGQSDNFIQEPMAANDALGSWGGFSSW